MAYQHSLEYLIYKNILLRLIVLYKYIVNTFKCTSFSQLTILKNVIWIFLLMYSFLLTNRSLTCVWQRSWWIQRPRHQIWSGQQTLSLNLRWDLQLQHLTLHIEQTLSADCILSQLIYHKFGLHLSPLCAVGGGQRSRWGEQQREDLSDLPGRRLVQSLAAQ